MKKTIILTLAVITTAFAADSATDIHLRRRPTESELLNAAIMERAPEAAQKLANAAENLALKKSNIYVRMNVLEPNVQRTRSPVPGIGIGFRRTMGSSAVDFSAAYSRGASHHRRVEMITLPKISYLYYFSPLGGQSLYAGPAMAFGRVKSTAGHLFEGLIPSASIGFELSRRASMLSFLQLDVSLPLVASRLRGPLPGVVAEFAFGAGF